LLSRLIQTFQLPNKLLVQTVRHNPFEYTQEGEMTEQTLTRALETGNAALMKRSNALGGTKRSPFLTAPFNKIDRALGTDTILHMKIVKWFRNTNDLMIESETIL
jgi:hypothetical protein